MKKYINHRIYTDVKSYLVTEIDEVKGTAIAIEVEKRITLKMIPGGFAGHCPDLQSEFDAAEPEGRHLGLQARDLFRPPHRQLHRRRQTADARDRLGNQRRVLYQIRTDQIRQA